MYIRTPERIKWIQKYLNDNDNKPQLSDDQRKHILKKLIQANNFESFLHKPRRSKDFHWKEEKH